MTAPRRVLLLGVIATGVAALLTVGVMPVQADLTVPNALHHEATSAPLAQPVYAVVFRGDVGDLLVQPGARASVATVREWNYAAPTVDQSLSNGVLTISTTCPHLPQDNCSVDITVALAAPASVDAQAPVGNITTKNAGGDQVLHANVGDVDVTVPRGAYALTAGTGRYTGDVHVDGVTNDPHAPRRLVATTRVGDVTVTGR